MLDSIANATGLTRSRLGRSVLYERHGHGRNWWRIGASASVCLTGLLLLVPNVTPLLNGNEPPLGIGLALLGTAVSMGLVGAGGALYYSGFSAANAIRIAVWNLLGIVVLGLVMLAHVVHESLVGGTFVAPWFTLGNLVAIGAAAHVIIGFYDARRVRAEQLARERKKLAVLTRVLRHNLRNEATVMLGHADNLLSGVEEPGLQLSAEKVREKALLVGGLADETEQIMDAVQRRSGPTQRVDISDVTADVVSEARENYDHASVSLSGPDSCFVRGDPGISAALENLVENAVVHNDAEKPQVWVRTTVEGDRVRVSVADDGPGIPEHERSVVTGDAEITQLVHGSGLGLWVVQSVMDACGGAIDFTDREDGGSVVTLSFSRSD